MSALASDDLKFFHIFDSVAAAMADAQEELEKLAPSIHVHYAIPRSQSDVRFRLQFDSKRKVLLLFRLKGSSSHSANRFRFSVLATPERPVPPPPQLPAMEIAIPPFLLPADSEQEIGRTTEQLGGEASGPEAGDDTGIVCFQMVEPLRYFVVRVDDKPKRDKIHIFLPDPPQRTTFTRNNDRKTRIYSPLRELFHEFRAAQRSRRLTTYPYTRGMNLQWGWDNFDEIFTALWESYGIAMQDLSGRNPSGDPPIFYRIDSFSGELFFSEWQSTLVDQPIDNFFDAEDNWIHNLVALRHDSSLSAARIQLQDAEFILAGDARSRFLDIISAREVSERIASECSDLAPVEAAEFRGSPADALILLSYDKAPPDKGFLVLWPVGSGDFLFSFDSDGEKLDKLKAHAFIPLSADADFAIDDDTYEVIHNFFRAVRLWRSRRPKTTE